MPHGPDLLILAPPTFFEENSSDEEEYHPEKDSNEPLLFNQSELNDLVRELKLTKDCADLLGSRLNAKNVLAPCTTYSWYRHREE